MSKLGRVASLRALVATFMASCKASAEEESVVTEAAGAAAAAAEEDTAAAEEAAGATCPEEEAAAAEEAAGAAEIAGKSVVRLALSCSSLSRVFNNMKSETVTCVTWRLSAPPRAALRKCS